MVNLVKIFEQMDHLQLDGKINEFLKAHPQIKLKDIKLEKFTYKYAQNLHRSILTALILYEE
ncbi:MAG: hypothetical protein ACXAC7_06200 [Candidatus Hodarchaeales archaeon]|jgi:hypothetical protein